MLPVTIVTGALGSGKTTLIHRILRDPAFARTAVIVNEFGEIPLDHMLVASSDESVLTLATGCLCCTVQTDLARTLLELLVRRDAGTADYERVLIETSGLADPTAMIQALLGDSAVSATHLPPYVVTVVDAVLGDGVLADRPEASRQIALADRLLVSKTDLQPLSETLMAQVRALNPAAPVGAAAEATPADLFDGRTTVLPAGRPGLPPPLPHADIDTFTLVRDRPLPALALTLLLQALAEHCGRRLLRFKGLVAIEEMPGQPAVIHGVRHVVSAPVFLERWPSDDHTTRIVFIATGVPRFFPARLLDAIEEEVRDAQAL